MNAEQTDRQYWIHALSRIAEPVLANMAARTLKERMPVEAIDSKRARFSHLEAIGRLLAGLAPWLEREQVHAQEERLRQRYADLARQALDAATAPSSPDYCNFGYSMQPIVDAAFLAQALLRAPNELWEKLDPSVKRHVVQALKQTRSRKPYANNWLLFSAMIETALYRMGESDYDPMRIDYALKQHEQWYLGDGVYGDGPRLHNDYYNSFVIQPMLIDIIEQVRSLYADWKVLRAPILERARRYAVIQERMISPEGTYPVIGRSITYRFGAFHLLAQIALRQELDPTIQPAQVRCALTAVIKRVLAMPGTFDEQGWLTIGLSGHQPELGESYISTGSLYLCAAVFLPLGLTADNAFWQGQAPWTAQKAWGGASTPIDHALRA
ncbi:DUF2264 domain-containing protein [Dictyobacter aurantiacus]|uniref:DUF2264 domain-containing protein n=1 Tax=Dictyobacter aurantiacus TaxID=1936993 RepID=A0A401ZDN2_9CHLR|nr:DUF2264 domain-containing protein [Dictyobacter aurantiacus]GCE04808.1 hypothetical protein KDAU_21370 [Dictyobacter aurantiacus]